MSSRADRKMPLNVFSACASHILWLTIKPSKRDEDGTRDDEDLFPTPDKFTPEQMEQWAKDIRNKRPKTRRGVKPAPADRLPAKAGTSRPDPSASENRPEAFTSGSRGGTHE